MKSNIRPITRQLARELDVEEMRAVSGGAMTEATTHVEGVTEVMQEDGQTQKGNSTHVETVDL